MDRLVETTAGTVKGRRLGAVDEFLGIPFAAPPVGPLRFRPPQPREPWAGALDCTAFGPIPPQAPGGPVDPVMGIGNRPQSEDCLSLNVWAPAGDGAQRPVLLWLYGGGFTAGCTAAPWMHGANLAAHGAVVVSCNYRVGALGFLHLDGLLGDEYAGSGNVGLLDVVAALEWVRDNAAGFGGDPSRVTVFGESAGGVAGALLLAMPSARGLLHRVAVQSGGAHTVSAPDEADATARALLKEMGLAPAEAARLVDAPVEDLLAAQQRALTTLAQAQFSGPMRPRFGMPIQPVADDVVLAGPVLDTIAAGPADVELLVGSNRDELNLTGALMYGTDLGEAELAERAAGMFGGEEAGRHAVEVYRAGRPGASPAELLFAMDGDRCVRIPAIRLAEAHPGPVWSYLLTLEGTGMGTVMGAAHALEIPFVFDNLEAQDVETMLGPVTDDGRKLASRMGDAWVAFAADGRPSLSGGPDWPAYKAETRMVMELAAEHRVLSDPHGTERALWDHLA